MKTSPYRTPAERSEERPTQADFFEADLAAVYAVVWIASMIRLVQAVTRGEALGTEILLAGPAVVVLPALAERAVTALLQRRRQGPADGDSWIEP